MYAYNNVIIQPAEQLAVVTSYQNCQQDIIH